MSTTNFYIKNQEPLSLTFETSVIIGELEKYLVLFFLG